MNCSPYLLKSAALFALVAILLVGVGPQDAIGASGATERPQTGRMLGEHVVYSPAYSDAAALTTHFGFEQGLAMLEIPDARIQGVGEPKDLQLTGLVESLDAGIRFSPWFAFEGRFEGQAVVGSNPDSAFHIGGSFGTAWEAQAGVRLVRDESRRFQLVGRGGIRKTDGRRVHPAAVVQRVVEDPEGSAKRILDGEVSTLLVQNESGQMASASLSAVKGLWERFALQLSLEGRSGTANLELTGRDREIHADVVRHRLAAGATFTGHARPLLPLALQLEYRLSYLIQLPARDPPVDDVIPQDTVSAGLFLAGWPQLALGLRGSTLLRRDRQENRRFWYGQFVMRYFFEGP